MSVIGIIQLVSLDAQERSGVLVKRDSLGVRMTLPLFSAQHPKLQTYPSGKANGDTSK